MLFYVGMTIRVPHDVAPERDKQLIALELERAAEKRGEARYKARIEGLSGAQREAGISGGALEGRPEARDEEDLMRQLLGSV